MIGFKRNFDFWALLFPKTMPARVGLHILFWVLFVVYHMIYFIPLSFEIDITRQTVYAYTLYYARYIPIFYFCILSYKLLQQYFFRVALWLILLLIATAITHFMTVMVFYVADHLYGLANTAANFQLLGKLYLSPFQQIRTKDLLLLIYDIEDMQLLILPVGILMIKYGILHERTSSQLKAEQLKSQLQALRYQLAPHFVFNIINSAFAVILPISQKAAAYLGQMSEVLRFALYETTHDTLPLSKEIRALRQLVKLQYSRSDKRAVITLRQKGKVLPAHRIPTLLLVSLAENAFKHGIHTTTGKSRVDIRIEVIEQTLHFFISNTKPATARANRIKSSGIGLKNLSQSLDLHFQTSYSCNILETDDNYSVTLQIPLIP